VRSLLPAAIALGLAVAAIAIYAVTDALFIPPAGQGYWHTDGTQIYDVNDRQVRIAGVTWYGMESNYWVPAGLDYQPYTRIMDEVKRYGYNTIRLPFSNQLVESNPIVTRKIAANPQFRGKHAMFVMDSIVRYAHKIGLKIILDDHRSRASTPKTVNILDQPFWYTRQYPESAWIHDWVSLARRYEGNDTVIGFDLRNEPHTNGPGPWNLHAYLNQGATWGPYKGVDNPRTDWRLAAEKAGNAVLAINPHLLMFVEGLQLYADPASRTGAEAYWWGSILRGVRNYPVVFHVPHQLVYSPHDWGPRKWPQWWFPHMTYTSMQKIWEKNWAFIIATPHAAYAAPIWIGEFGTCTSDPICVSDVKQGSQAQWFQYFLRFLHENPELSWSFYALNGRNSNDHVAHNGLLNPGWSGLASQAVQHALASVQQR
jgi:endoglucanase